MIFVCVRARVTPRAPLGPPGAAHISRQLSGSSSSFANSQSPKIFPPFLKSGISPLSQRVCEKRRPDSVTKFGLPKNEGQK